MAENGPDFAIVGAAKSGTTSLANYLSMHPDISICQPKEPHYFSRLSNDSLNIGSPRYSPEEYLGLYDRRSRLLGDASTSYLYEPTTARHLRESNPAMRVIIILRDPVDRAFSHYIMNRRDGIEPCISFREAVERESARADAGWPWYFRYVDVGHYRGQVKRYRDEFPEAQVFLLSFDDLTRSPEEVTRRSVKFLGCNPDLLGDARHPRFNVSRSPHADNPVNRFVRKVPVLRRQLEEGSTPRLALKKVIPRDMRLKIKEFFLPPEGAKGMNGSETRLLGELLADDIAFMNEEFPAT